MRLPVERKFLRATHLVRFLLAIALLMAGHVGFAACPALQPGVKEYRAESGTADYSAATVVYQNQEQCRIGADEIPATGRKTAYEGGGLPKSGVFVAVASSAFGKKLVSRFKLDVPDRKQGYAIRVKGAQAAIVGYDAIGALYGAETFRQMMANGGKVESAVISDWPDILFRGGVSIGRGLWKWTEGEDAAGRVEGLKRGIDELVRHKMNGIEDFFYAWIDSPDAFFAVYREVLAYAQSRGVRALFNAPAGTGLWSNRNRPAGLTPEKWPCVMGVRDWGDIYYCWADDGEIKAAANRCIDYLMKFGVTDPVIRIHPVDSCSVEDPEGWSHRCVKCRARWKDDERWKASANLFNIWRREFDKRMPKAQLASPVVPYLISWLERPEGKRDALWRQNVIDYWSKLDAALEDKDMAFTSWIATKSAFDEYRRLVPSRVVIFGDTFPQNPGLFLTCRRKIGTMHESNGRVGYKMTGSDAYARWESCLLAAEYAWDVHAPGWEPYDGINYWHPVVDTTGPEIVMTNVLPRICRTFWGEAIAPHMCKVMSSGILPKYLENPTDTVSYWNKVLRDPNFDPLQSGGGAKSGKPSFVDSLEFRRSQLEVAKLCARELEAARPLAGDLPHFKRRYFESLADAAPHWVEQAQELVARFEIDAALEAGDAARAREIAVAAAAELPEGEVRSRMEHVVEILGARPDDSAVPSREGLAGRSTPSKGFWRNAEVWRGEKVIDAPLVINRRNISIAPGSRIVFKGEGSLRVENGLFRAVDAEFVGEGVLTNAWRISVSGDKAEFVNCRFEGLATHDPGGKRWFHGGMRLTAPCARVAGCRFERMQSPTFVRCPKARVEDNFFSCADVGVYILDSPESCVERNVFVPDSGGRWGAELAGSPHSEVVHNRFEGVQGGVYARTGSSHVIVAGNVFEKCARPISAITSKGVVVVDGSPNRLPKLPVVETRPHDMDCLIESGHIQGACCSEKGFYLSHSMGLDSFDWTGRHLKHVDAPVHLGDTAYADGRIYGVFGLRRSGQKMYDAKGYIRVWNEDLEVVAEKPVDAKWDLDGAVVLNGLLYVGVDKWGRPDHNDCCVRTYDLDLNFKEEKDIDLGYPIKYGVQTMATDGSDIFLGNYGGASKVSADLRHVQEFKIKKGCRVNEGFCLVPESVAGDTNVFFTVNALGGGMREWRKDPVNNPPRIQLRFYKYENDSFTDITRNE